MDTTPPAKSSTPLEASYPQRITANALKRVEPLTGSIIKVAGCWELGWNTPIKEVDLWETMLRDFCVEHWYMEPVSGIVGHDVCEIASLETLVEDERALGITIVFVDEKGETPLADFEHPQNVLYILGKASYSPLKALGRDGDLSVRIETPAQAALLWPHQAIAIVLYDKIRKIWPQQ
jgi:hypothetical protein